MENFIKLFSPVKFGLVLAITTILYGFMLGGAFGAKEDSIQEFLKSQAQPVLSTVYKNDQNNLDKVVNKSWNYIIRSHMHGGGIGTASTILITILALMSINAMIKTVISLSIGLGAFGYSFFWLLAAIKAPSLGSTGLAKESLSWLAIPSAGLLIMGTLSVLSLAIYLLFIKKEEIKD